MGSQHSLVACSIDRKTGGLKILGPKRSVPYRPIHLCTDENGENSQQHIIIQVHYLYINSTKVAVSKN